jgi:hypothetical protein
VSRLAETTVLDETNNRQPIVHKLHRKLALAFADGLTKQVSGRLAFCGPGDWSSPSFVTPALVDLRQRSLLRATLLVLGSLAAALLMAGWPNDQPSLKLAVPSLVAMLGFVDTFRCLRRQWGFYHGAVVLMLYMNVMAISIILFLFLYPYGEWLM